MEASGLDREAIERHAGEVLGEVPSWIWDGETLPVPVEHIVDSCYGLLVREVEDMTKAPGFPEPGASVSGLLLAGSGEIWVNAAEARQWPARRRFTLGHELGHWVLHRSGQEALFCRRATVAPEETPADSRPPQPVTEEEANMFAAALLMPAELMRRHYRDTRGRPDCFEEMCRRFGSSAAAMGKRLHQTVPRSGE